MGLGKWFMKPLVDIVNDFKQPKEQTIIIDEKPEHSLSEAEHKTKIFRPKTFEQYIGQNKAKDILISYIKAIKKRQRVFPHILIHGKAGCGKTTLAKIIANILGANFVETITSDIKDNIDLEIKIEDADGGILFLDEIHSLDRDTAEGIYTIMEDFTSDGRPIKPFTLIGATTELGEILKNRRPFYDRFKIILELEDYTDQELATIASQYKEKTFPEDSLNPKIYEIIGKNSRNTPRTAIRLTEATIYLNEDIDRVLKNFSIIKDGYTEKDLKVLEYVAINEKGVGLQGLCSFLGTSSENYSYEIEPYLLKNGLIIRTPRGRKIAEKGIEKIKELGGLI